MSYLPRRGDRADALPHRLSGFPGIAADDGGSAAGDGDIRLPPLPLWAFFALPSPMEEYEKQQVLQEALSPVEKFEHTFQNYSDKQLQKVIDGKDYVPDAKKAARNLLYRRKYGE